jgi:hypothetical protein
MRRKRGERKEIDGKRTNRELLMSRTNRYESKRGERINRQTDRECERYQGEKER